MKKGRCKGNDDTEAETGDAQADCAGERPQVAGVEAERGQCGVKLTDAEAINALRKVRCYDLEERLSDYPEEERDGRTDWDMIANEAGWLLDSFHDDSCANYEALKEAKQVLRETNYGKVYSGLLTSVELTTWRFKVKDAKDFVNMVNRLERFVNKLKSMGLYCPYC